MTLKMLQHCSQVDWVKAQSFVGTPYLAGEFDCAHFFIKAQKEIFNRTVLLPFEKHNQGKAGQAAQIKLVRDNLAVKIEPENGCAVLMISINTWHVGTLLIYNGTQWVLHNSRAIGGVELTKIRDLPSRGLRVEGFYRLCTN